MSDLDTWIPSATEPGLSVCRLHPTEAPFAPYLGCSSCHTEPATALEPAPTERETEAAGVIAATLVREADARGLPDCLELETRADMAWRETKRELRVCRRIARECEQRAFDLRDGKVPSAEPERDAMRWLSEGARYRQIAAKAIDSAAKVTKLALPSAIERERARRLLERARLLGPHERRH